MKKIDAVGVAKKAESVRDRAIMKMAVATVSEIVRLFPLANEVQPNIAHAITGMGTWCFHGTGIAIDDEENIGELYECNAADVEYAANDESCLNIPMNEALTEIAKLLDVLVDVNHLNFSTYQDCIGPEGIMFYCDDTKPDGEKSPFGIPSSGYTQNSTYFKMLTKCGIPTVFIPHPSTIRTPSRANSRG